MQHNAGGIDDGLRADTPASVCILHDAFGQGIDRRGALDRLTTRHVKGLAHQSCHGRTSVAVEQGPQGRVA